VERELEYECLSSRVAAIGLAAHTSAVSLAELVDALSPHLIATADRVSARLGYRRDDE
jgi:DNA-binding IclR family transcriptional regulator